MGKQKSSLTEWPEDLKDVIDWFLRVGGKDTGNHNNNKSVALKNAVEKLYGYDVFKVALGNGNFPGLFKKVAEGLQSFIGYDNNGQQPLDGKGIALEGGYTSSYGSAKWEDKLDHPTSPEAKKAALIFLVSTPILYFGLTYIYCKCSNSENYGGWNNMALSNTHSPLYLFMSAMGFKINELQNIRGSEIARRLISNHTYGFDELKEAKKGEASYSGYLDSINLYGGGKISNSAASCPLYALYNAATAYLKSRSTGSEVQDETLQEIKKKLLNFRDSCGYSYSELKYEINNFLTAVEPSQSSKSHASPDTQPSTAGPVAGTLTTLSLGSGAAAVYVLNIGGARTLVNGLLKIGKDVGGGPDGTKSLSDAVYNLLDGINASAPELLSKFQAIKQALKSAPQNGIIDTLGQGLKTFKEGILINGSGTSEENVYQAPGNGNNLSQTVPNAAKIFLGCVPLCFYGLSYLYWRCSDKGGWRALKLNDRYGSALKHFMASQGFDTKQLKGDSTNGQNVTEALQSFQELQGAAAGMDFLIKFFGKLHSNFNGKLKEVSPPIAGELKKHPLSCLHLLASAYFQHQRSTDPSQSRHPPSTIREMLHWLSALTVTPQFIDLLDNFSGVIGTDFKIAVSGSHEQNEKLSPDELAGHLITSCLSSSWTLGTIQGPGDFNNPLLHEIYSSSEFSYPSSPSVLLSKLADYAYALQFQLHFLYQQCSNTYTKACGWNQCTYGKGINSDPQRRIVQSHICVTGCTKSEHGTGDHSQRPCEHAGCGKGTPSPLQAFLTDKLTGFSRGHPSSHSGHLAECSGYFCHVPMGFNPNDLRAASGGNTQGSHISATLKAFCGGFNTPLRQLSEKLGCLTKRTPRTLGDLFGFTWHLNGQLFKNNRPTLESLISKFNTAFGINSNLSGTFTTDPYAVITKIWNAISQIRSKPQGQSSTATGLSLSLEAMAPTIPFLYQLFMAKDPNTLPGALFDLKGMAEHSGHSIANLTSLYSSGCKEQDKTCGPYLYPITHSDGATYAPTHASTYLSWVLYLSDDLQSWFQDMLDEFKNIDCKAAGCVRCDNSNHKVGQHGTSADCSCPSVVQCGGTLPLLYRHGFRYYSPILLMGGSSGSDNSKRTCQQFHDQLSNVLAEGAPLTKLLESIDDFLYLFRFYFLYNQSAFWTIYICIILYTFFFLLDTLRVRSHLHFPSSNSIPPVSLLGTGKATALKKFTKLTYFTTDLT
ncbi:variant erythrocyte surface antigen-1 family protein [Babesia caballi]|uniref:Variant erythrocyte surface antigen-1 family protein n=1 Tax=Babesia caballi TaxID=5871 RepID=A0AAV4LQI5_BABCB|nr:variant erythrocyte surface antigen-1 family protein [Babesia caballi]